MITHELFPTVIGEYNLNRDFTEKEKTAFQSLNEMHKNIGNLTSVNKNVLDIKELFGIKEQISMYAKEYIDKIINPKANIFPYITQSWINFTDKGQWHHKHNHSNSFLSGVLYISANNKIDKITFHDGRYNQINIPPKEYNRLNSSSWKLGVGSKDIFIFPSHLIHEVEISENTNPRVSLSFNIFVKGNLGDYNDMTELILK